MYNSGVISGIKRSGITNNFNYSTGDLYSTSDNQYYLPIYFFVYVYGVDENGDPQYSNFNPPNETIDQSNYYGDINVTDVWYNGFYAGWQEGYNNRPIEPEPEPEWHDPGPYDSSFGTDEYAEGWEARRNGFTEDQNPYDSQTQSYEYDEWRGGWRSCDQAGRPH